ncbi:MAG: aldolase [Omnitrophica WOR_2 bacterium GWF2_43_52]|nr:MAG: aldolase [Omnitrophica WOR_2 bacterium GWA2_44_7]OGX14588.1 MAG: aldolase [Omnitrophica WOR_2 bacterium GWC2_44_8]OGX20786.1 MAG: aldolase [Omnitrophica WOR_2 bacterium GWF2_43_52]HAH19813.1 aldolase [Candidatus Omnitrophota bacterium]HBG63438.1 aldolase [Candidatus Omnitrophota bacterium]
MARRGKDISGFVKDLIAIDDVETKKRIYKKILGIAYKSGIYPASIHDFYSARAKEGFGGFTVPAINLRSMTYDLARALFRVAQRNNSGAFIFEIAKSEMGYTSQPPCEYGAMILAAAIKEGYSGPVFIQADHTQVNIKKFKENPEKEIETLQALIAEAIEFGFYNIDIDSSTLVDLSQSSVKKQQYYNFDTCAKLTQFIRRIEPRGITVSVGGEIGEVGHKNSTPEELRVFMDGFKERLRKGLIGISKISVQTGTSHGGVVLPDGTIAQVALDFDTLKALSEIARKEFGLAGAVQHGASTLPSEAFHKFAECETAEVHLATEFQNMIYDSPHFPHELKEKIYAWLKVNAASEKKEGETDEQFFYKTRKKALGPFKRDIMGLADSVRDAIAGEIEKKFEFLFKQLAMINKKELVDKYVSLKRVISRKRKEGAQVVHDGEGAD